MFFGPRVQLFEMSNIYQAFSNLIFDFVFSIFLANNLAIFVWRIIWDTQDLYLKSNVYFNSIISLLIAYSLIIVIKCIQINELNFEFHRHAVLESQSVDAQNNTMHKFKLRMFILLISIANINHCRSLWNFTTEYTYNSVNGLLTIGALSLLILLCLKRLCATISSPFQIAQDSYEVAFQIRPTSANHNYYLSLINMESKNVNIFKLSFSNNKNKMILLNNENQAHTSQMANTAQFFT